MVTVISDTGSILCPGDSCSRTTSGGAGQSEHWIEGIKWLYLTEYNGVRDAGDTCSMGKRDGPNKETKTRYLPSPHGGLYTINIWARTRARARVKAD